MDVAVKQDSLNPNKQGHPQINSLTLQILKSEVSPERPSSLRWMFGLAGISTETIQSVVRAQDCSASGFLVGC